MLPGGGVDNTIIPLSLRNTTQIKKHKTKKEGKRNRKSNPDRKQTHKRRKALPKAAPHPQRINSDLIATLMIYSTCARMHTYTAEIGNPPPVNDPPYPPSSLSSFPNKRSIHLLLVRRPSSPSLLLPVPRELVFSDPARSTRLNARW